MYLKKFLTLYFFQKMYYIITFQLKFNKLIYKETGKPKFLLTFQGNFYYLNVFQFSNF